MKLLKTLLLEPLPIDINISSQTNIDCNNSTGAVSVTPDGGTPPYSILWDNGSSFSTISNLVAGLGLDLQLDCSTSAITPDVSTSSQRGDFTYEWTTGDGNIAFGSSILSSIMV